MGNGKNNGGWMVVTIWTALCWVAFFSPLVGEFGKAAEYHYWPDRTRLTFAVLQGLAAIGTTTVAFFNTSYSKYKAAADEPKKETETIKP